MGLKTQSKLFDSDNLTKYMSISRTNLKTVVTVQDVLFCIEEYTQDNKLTHLTETFV